MRTLVTIGVVGIISAVGITLTLQMRDVAENTQNQQILGASALTVSQPFQHVSASDFQNYMEYDDAVILDVRTSAEYAGGHIDGSVNVDVNNPSFTQDLSEFPKDRTYLVYCRSGNRSRVAVEMMRELGFDQVVGLEGGVESWQAAGFPLE